MSWKLFFVCCILSLSVWQGFWCSLPAGNCPAGWQEKLRQVKRALGICHGLEGLDSLVSFWMAGHSPVCFSIVAGCVSPFHWGCRGRGEIWQFGGRVGFVAYRVWWSGWGNSPVDWLMMQRQVWEGPRVLPQYGGPREGMSCQLASHSPLGPLSVAAGCASLCSNIYLLPSICFFPQATLSIVLHVSISSEASLCLNFIL